MFVYNIVIMDESRQKLEIELERWWRFALERRGMKINRKKTEYTCIHIKQGKTIIETTQYIDYVARKIWRGSSQEKENGEDQNRRYTEW